MIHDKENEEADNKTTTAWPPPIEQAHATSANSLAQNSIKKRGWQAISLALLGLLLTASFKILNDHMLHIDDMAWEEGGGFVVAVLCLVLTTASELGAMRYGLRAWTTVPGKVAVGIASLMLLSAALGICTSLMSLVRH